MSETNKTATVVSFNEAREKRLEDKRRKNERVFVKSLLGIYAVSDNQHNQSVEINDMSEDGLSFTVPFNPEKIWPSDANNVSIRLYFSQDRYLPITVSVKNSSDAIVDGSRMIRFGCTVVTDGKTAETYKQFVRFVKALSETAHLDQGQVGFYYL